MKHDQSALECSHIPLGLEHSVRSRLAEKDKYFAAASIYASIEAAFAHWEDVPNLVHADMFKAYLEALAGCETRFDFFRETRRYLATFCNSHTTYFDERLFETGEHGFGLLARRIGSEWVVTHSTHDDISPGTAILTIEDCPARDFLAPFNQFISASRSQDRDYRVWRQPYFFPSPLRLTLDDGESAQLEKQAWSEAPPAVSSSVVGSTPSITIRSFEEPAFEDAALSFVTANKDSPALVIDIRGNGGGDTPIRLIRALMNIDYPSWKEATPLRMGVDVAIEHMERLATLRAADRPNATYSWSARLNRPDDAAYRGKLFILHDIGTASAAEDFLMPFKVTGRATLIGETTSGSSGQPLIVRPFDKAVFTVGAKREIFPNGDQFEGRGIAPDIAVRLNREDISKHRDAALDELKAVI
ncbi:S41 family peptidase [Rhizobium sp. YIM 134829]|uniref:S41 family peptidase n=1 Tax=Rhizobium sp. YIM 134829 TaxID=3390453 RepID=UPI00397ADEEE